MGFDLKVEFEFWIRKDQMCFDVVLPGALPGPPEAQVDLRLEDWFWIDGWTRILSVSDRLKNCEDAPRCIHVAIESVDTVPRAGS